MLCVLRARVPSVSNVRSVCVCRSGSKRWWCGVVDCRVVELDKRCSMLLRSATRVAAKQFGGRRTRCCPDSIIHGTEVVCSNNNRRALSGEPSAARDGGGAEAVGVKSFIEHVRDDGSDALLGQFRHKGGFDRCLEGLVVSRQIPGTVEGHLEVTAPLQKIGRAHV